jgi:choline-sulfatase
MNVLILMTDQQRADTISPDNACLTPNIDRLLSEGVRFTEARTANSICSPARASLMTGLYPSAHGMVDCTHNVPEYRAKFDETLPTWSKRLEDVGFVGGYFGKWHVERANQPQPFGFSTYIGKGSKQYKEYRHSLGYGEKQFVRRRAITQEGYAERYLYGVYDEPAEATEPYFLYTEAMNFIGEQAAKGVPWMAVVSVIEPHDPFYALKSYYDRYDPDRMALPASWQDDLQDKPGVLRRMRSVWRGLSETDLRQATACYYAMCTLIDDQVGRMLDYLQKSGLQDDTLIIYVSDHGEMLGSHGLFHKGIPAFEESYRIPMVISGPGVRQPGRSSAAHVNIVDLAPTLIELTGAEPISGVHGKSLVPLLQENAIDIGQQPWNETFAEFHGQRYFFTQRIYWHSHYKYVFNGFDLDELYDLEADPHELNNLAEQPAYLPLLEEMIRAMWRWVHKVGDKTLIDSDYPTLRFVAVGPDSGKQTHH